jgi:sulfite reductase (ferredoxin)
MTSTAREPRSNGQWAVDGHTPLNHNEEFKAVDDPLTVRDRVEQVYATQGFDSIPADDLHGRLRWWGLYTQRRQDIDGSRTASLGPDERSDRYFLMRVRLDGGAVTTDQLRTLAGISTDYARNTADISDRQNIQYHWIEIEKVPEIWARLEAAGMKTTEACGDTPRVILGSPVAGIAADEIIDPTPTIAEIVDRFIGDPELANLPRKFKSAITGHPSLDVVHEINDISLVGVVHPELGAGYDLWVGGGLSVAPRLAERLGAFVRADQAAEVWYGVIRIFRDYGYRRLADGPAPVVPGEPGDHVGVHTQKDGLAYIGLAPTVGRVSGEILGALADAAEAAGSHRVRFTPHQKLLVLDVAPDKVDALLAAVEPLGLTANPSPFRRSTMACTGIEYCKLAFVETKAAAADTIAQMESRLGDLHLDRPISLHVNGCPNSCCRIQIADIGLKGQLMKGADGTEEFAYQVHLGGGLASVTRDDAGLGRTVRGLKVTATDLPDYVERVTRAFVAGREADESFADWSHRVDEEALR